MTEQTVEVGERLAVSYDITNRGQSDGEQTVELLVDGEVVDSEALAVDAGSTGRMSLVTDAFTDEDDGQLYEVEIVTDDRVARVMTVEVVAIPDSGGDHQWNYEEGEGTTLFDAIGDLDGAINGATWDGPEGAGEHYLTFDGADDYVDLQSNDLFVSLREDVQGTLFTWTRLDDDDDDIQTVIGGEITSSDTDFAWSVRFDTNEFTFHLTLDDDGENVSGGTPEDHIDDWIAYAVVVDTPDMRLYVASPSDYSVTEIATGDAPSSTTQTLTDDYSIGRDSIGDQRYLEAGMDLTFFDSDPWTEAELQTFVDDTKEFYE